ncbi:hypothetical protein Adu01nite_35630 [Paractinoplanes durhamensis]|uniref:Uncharacterized protein n=1 Tax=Paractinoplanes durhamensis TaxID=113563 RepID=A0ABQ3YXB8_9ACTN|nr:hypothetical protein Adu01nite_35630 [Actinoplanes durhamensis]
MSDLGGAELSPSEPRTRRSRRAVYLTENQAEMSKTLLVATTADDEAICRIIVAGKVAVERTSKKVAACMENMPKS